MMRYKIIIIIIIIKEDVPYFPTPAPHSACADSSEVSSFSSSLFTTTQRKP